MLQLATQPVTMEIHSCTGPKRSLHPVLILIIFTFIFAGAIPDCNFGPDCQFTCHCKYNETCDERNGSCTSGCDDGNRDSTLRFDSGMWWGPGCQIGNIAYNKNATQYGQWANLTPNLAVDGYKGNVTFIGTEQHCAHPRARNNKTATWWQVDLGGPHVIFNVTILHRDTIKLQHRLWHTAIGVGDQSNISSHQNCAIINETDPDFDNDTQLITKSCEKETVGRYVSVRRLSTGRDIDQMTICEIYIIGFQIRECNGSWGPGCLFSCNCKSQCHPVSGICPTNCLPGWMGETCQQECPLRHWGYNCSNTCNCFNGSEICNKSTGSCKSGCMGTFSGPSCDKRYIQIGNTSTGMGPSVDIYFLRWNSTYEDVIADHYIIQFRKSSDNDWTDGATLVNSGSDPNVLMATQSGLDNGTIYEFRVVPKILMTSTPVSYTDFPERSKQPDLPIVLIAGVAGGLLVLIILLLVIIIIIVRRKRKRKKKEQIAQSKYDANGYLNEAYEDATGEPVVRLTKMVLDANEPAGAIYENTKVLNKPAPHPEPMPVNGLTTYILEKKRQDELKTEFESLPQDAIAPWERGNLQANRAKNRFLNIRAYDHSRVILGGMDEEDYTDYINASYISGYKDREKHYIASQGPREHTVSDMWWMIWQEGSNRVVMVTNLVEMSKNKCDLYWPIGKSPETYGDITVCLVNEEELADCVVRTFSMTSSAGKSRILYQFHFTSWPDHGVPEPATALLQFHQRVRSYDSQATGPMIVHCSAGVGRTGTFIAIDYLLEQAKAEQQVDVFGCVYKMRHDRMKMVQTKDQYTFVHDALLEALVSGDTAIPANLFDSAYHELCKLGKLSEQFKVLGGLKSMIKRENMAGMEKYNLEKNRDLDIIPNDGARPFLSTKVTGTTNYINATYINGYKRKLAYLVTQSPLPKTVPDLWRLVYDHHSSTIIMLNNTGQDDSFPSYWPNNVDEGGNTLSFGPLKAVGMTTSDYSDAITISEARVSHSKKSDKEAVIVKQFHFKCWPEGTSVPSSRSAVLDLLDTVERWQQKSGNGPIIVHCLNGASRSGLIIAAMYMLDKLKVDQEVDIFQTVKYVRLNRPQLIEDLEQYVFLHELVLEYMSKYDQYANFK